MDLEEFELPDISAVERDDLNYASFLDDSVEQIKGMCERHNNEARRIVRNKRIPPEEKEALREKLEARVEKVKGIITQFHEALLSMIEIENLHQPGITPLYAQVFFVGSDGMLYETELDFYRNNRENFIPCLDTRIEELQRKEGIKKVKEKYGNKSVYFVHTPSRNTPNEVIIRYAAHQLQAEFDEKNPEIAKGREGAEIMKAKVAMGLAALLTLFSGGFAGEVVVDSAEYYKERCVPCEKKAACPHYEGLHAKYKAKSPQEEQIPNFFRAFESPN